MFWQLWAIFAMFWQPWQFLANPDHRKRLGLKTIGHSMQCWGYAKVGWALWPSDAPPPPSPWPYIGGVLGKLGPGKLGPGRLGPSKIWRQIGPRQIGPFLGPNLPFFGKLGPGKLGPLAANWAPANRAPADWAPWRQIGPRKFSWWQIGPRQIGPRQIGPQKFCWWQI